MGLTGPRDNPPFPREETCFLPRFIFSFEFTQDGCPGIFSAVPGGTTPGLMYTQDLRPGLLSAVPCGTQTGTGGSHADTKAPEVRLHNFRTTL